MIFHISWATDRIKLGGPSKWLQQWIYYEYSTIHIPLRQPEMLKKVAFLVFFGPYSIKFQQVPYHKNYNDIKLADLLKWPKDSSFYWYLT